MDRHNKNGINLLLQICFTKFIQVLHIRSEVTTKLIYDMIYTMRRQTYLEPSFLVVLSWMADDTVLVLSLGVATLGWHPKWCDMFTLLTAGPDWPLRSKTPIIIYFSDTYIFTSSTLLKWSHSISVVPYLP